MNNKRLIRQIKKAFSVNVEEHLAPWREAVESKGDLGEVAAFLAAFPIFLERIEGAYKEDEDRVAFAENALEISASELTAKNATLFGFNQTFNAMLDSLGQGFFVFGKDGQCGPVYSSACLKLLGGAPVGRSIMDVIKVPEEHRASFQDWMNLVFEDRINFADVAGLGHDQMMLPTGETIGLEYKPIRDERGKISRVMVIATDLTSKIEAQKQTEDLQGYVKFLASALKYRAQFAEFVREMRRRFQLCRTYLSDVRGAQVTLLERELHTLKGAASTYGLSELARQLHDLESTIRSGVSKSDLQWVIKPRVEFTATAFENILNENRDILGKVIQEEEVFREVRLSDLQTMANQLRGTPTYDLILKKMISIPAFELLSQFNETLRGDSQSTPKVGPIRFLGENIDLIPENYTVVTSTLVHIFKNIVAHGIEPSTVRQDKGKPALGQVTVEIKTLPQANQFQIIIADDGRGVDLEKIRERLRDQNQKDIAAKASDEELLEYLFQPGFTTTREVTTEAGRGVGLDAVRAAIQGAGGRIWIQSQAGHGTRFTIELPLLNEFQVAA